MAVKQLCTTKETRSNSTILLYVRCAVQLTISTNLVLASLAARTFGPACGAIVYAEQLIQLSIGLANMT